MTNHCYNILEFTTHIIQRSNCAIEIDISLGEIRNSHADDFIEHALLCKLILSLLMSHIAQQHS